MEKVKNFLFFVILFHITTQSPMTIDLLHEIKSNRIENKNWKLKAGYYEDDRRNYNLLNDPPTTYRLPNNTLPVRYDIFLRTDVDLNDFNFYGEVKIQIRAMETTNSVTLQYRKLEVFQVSIYDVTAKLIEKNLNFEHVEPKDYEFLRISLPKIMNKDEEFILHIKYNGVLNTKQAGFYRGYFTEESRIINYAITQFESTDARHAFPCYDEPGIRTPFNLQIQHHKSYNAYSNMDTMEIVPVNGTDYVISKFHETPSMQTYLLAFLVAPFEFISNNNTEIPQKIIARPSSIRSGHADFALNLTNPILSTLESHFGIKFTLPKLDHVAITHFEAGAMENWGLVTYREIALLFEATGHTETDYFLKRKITTIMAHEDAHQFFGNLVGPHWWTDLWLNEGLATLYEYYIPHLLYPTDGFMQWFRERELFMCFNIDVPTSKTSVPMSYYAESPKEIENKFDDISYSKGGVVMRMFQEALNVSTFTKGLTKYLRKMSFKAAIPDDLFSSIQDAYDEDYSNRHIDFSKAMGSWVYQAGYPIISVSKSGENFLFKQNRYPYGSGEIYSVPLSFATKMEPNFEEKFAKIWLTQEKMEVSQNTLGINNDQWIIFNIQQVGYYRVSYSRELWHSIAAGLRENLKKIHPINREVLITELDIGYSKLEELLASDVLEVLLYLVHEAKSAVWVQVDPILHSLSGSLYGTPAYNDFLRFLQFITRTQLEMLKIEELDGEPFEKAIQKGILKSFNCQSLHDLCLNYETKRLELYMEDNNNPPPDFCVAFRYIKIQTYIYFLNELILVPNLKHRYWILRGISCSTDKSLLNVLTLVLEDERTAFSEHEKNSIIGNLLLDSTAGLETGFKYLERNLEKISRFTSSLSLAVNTPEYSDMLNILLNDAIDEGFITLDSVQELRAAVDLNLVWYRKHFKAVHEWLEDFDDEMIIEEPIEGPEESTEAFTETPNRACAVFRTIIALLIPVYLVIILI